MEASLERTRVRPLLSEPVEVQLVGYGFVDRAQTRDIGVGGVGIWLPEFWIGCDIEADVDLIVSLPDAGSFFARGIIRHKTADRDSKEFLGVQFTQIAPTHAQSLREYVRIRAAQTRGDSRDAPRQTRGLA